MTSKPHKLGSVNAYSPSLARFNGRRFYFNGTVKGLCLDAYRVGARAGDRVEANFGFSWRTYAVVAAPHDTRANGLWLEEVK